MRILRPYPHVIGFYDGRNDAPRRYAEDNWYDDGALQLGICSYAIVSGAEAIIYDTHASLEHARAIRRALDHEGVTRITVVLSHWHADHVAGNAIFADCEIIASAATRDALLAHREDLENGAPPIDPLVMPTTTFENHRRMRVGSLEVELRQLDIHSFDGTVVMLPGEILLAGDTLEDPITYVVEPDRLAIHLADLKQLQTWPLARILPNHGSPETIAGGGCDARLIDATIRYLEGLLSMRTRCGPAPELLRLLAQDFDNGAITYHSAYETVHRHNMRLVQALGEAEAKA